MRGMLLLTVDRAMLADFLRLMGEAEARHTANLLFLLFDTGDRHCSLAAAPKKTPLLKFHCEVGQDKESLSLWIKETFRLSLSAEQRSGKLDHLAVQLVCQDNAVAVQCLGSLLLNKAPGTTPLLYEPEPGTRQQVFLCDAVERLSRNQPL